MMKLPKTLTSHDFRGIFTTDEAKTLRGIKPEALYGSEQWLYLSKRESPAGGKAGDAGTKCSDVLIGLTPTSDGKNYHMVEHRWVLPDATKHPELKLDDELHIRYCHVICGFFSSGPLYSPVDREELGVGLHKGVGQATPPYGPDTGVKFYREGLPDLGGFSFACVLSVCSLQA